MIRFYLIFWVLLPYSVLANEICDHTSLGNSLDLHHIAQFIEQPKNQKSIVGIQTINGHSLKMGTLIESPEDANIEIQYEKPFKLSFELAANTRVQIIDLVDVEKACGPKIKILEGQVTSDGNHLNQSDCEYELETSMFYVKPEGTKYSSRVINNRSLTERNNEFQEEIDVYEGDIQIRLVKISDRSHIKRKGSKKQNIAKNKNKKNQKSKSKIVRAKDTKSIKVQASSKVKAKSKVVKNKKGSNELLADIEIIDPFD